MMKKQKGITFVGMLLVAGMLFFVALIGMKIVPAYIEFFSVKKVITAMSNDSEVQNMSVKEVRNSFDKRAVIDNITAVKGEDLEISKEDGSTVVIAQYAVKTPLFGNLSACMDFTATTSKSRSKSMKGADI